MSRSTSVLRGDSGESFYSTVSDFSENFLDAHSEHSSVDAGVSAGDADILRTWITKEDSER